MGVLWLCIISFRGLVDIPLDLFLIHKSMSVSAVSLLEVVAIIGGGVEIGGEVVSCPSFYKKSPDNVPQALCDVGWMGK